MQAGPRREPPAVVVDVIDDDPSIRALLRAWLEAAGYETHIFASAADYLAAPAHRSDVRCLDLRMPEVSGLDLLRTLQRRSDRTPTIIFTADDDVQTAVTCMREGAFDFQVKPVQRDSLLQVIDAATRRNDATPAPEQPAQAGPVMLGASAAMDGVRREISRVFDTDITVFIRGESGTGKELVARSIHAAGSRATRPFVALNCGAIPETLQESVLFGHEKGAFTGATDARPGTFETADGGTLLLDEVAELSPAAQVRLLRVLQERSVERLGSSTSRPVDVRVLSATHRDLDAMVSEGSFRQDLYYRLVIYPIVVPPLRERLEDVALLFEHYLRHHATGTGLPTPAVGPSALSALAAHTWPGNIRELANLAHRCVVSHRGDTIDEHSLGLPSCKSDTMTPAPIEQTSVTTLADAERRAVQDALEICGGNVSAAAKRLGIGRATFYRKLMRYGLSRAG